VALLDGCIKRILIVDDEMVLAENLGVFFANAGASVAVAHSGEEALETAERFLPECVIADCNLPGMNGMETLRRILDRRPGVVPVLITGRTDEVIREAGALGIHNVLIKPFPLVELCRFMCGPLAPAGAPCDSEAKKVQAPLAPLAC
jgi:DNA-binding response OmpR family regulator